MTDIVVAFPNNFAPQRRFAAMAGRVAPRLVEKYVAPAPRKGSTLERVRDALRFASDADTRLCCIQRLGALSDAALEARGYDRRDLVKQVYWAEFTN